jgi:hypothetical protein
MKTGAVQIHPWSESVDRDCGGEINISHLKDLLSSAANLEPVTIRGATQTVEDLDS